VSAATKAAVQAGLGEVPVIIRDIDDDEVTEIALIENLQRKDLTPFEEAEALAQLSERGGLTHDQIAKRLGKSRTAVTETLTLIRCPRMSGIFVDWPTFTLNRCFYR
jgi:ParB family chromosome partitioning protein